ncbi:MAG: VOC family protein [Sphingobium sp.]
MANAHGSWIWYELMTPDPKASKAFYDAVIGWTIEDVPTMAGDPEYRMIAASDGPVGGVLTLDADMLSAGARAGWLGYVVVDDVDATVAELKSAGGAVHLAPYDIEGVGRMAMLSDPQGVPFYVMRGASDENSRAFGRMDMGHVSWNELQTAEDAAASFAFYHRLFGWEKAGGMPMPWGEYAFLRNRGEGEVWGATMPREKADQPVGWTFYFRVPDIEAAFDQVRVAGGTPLGDPMEVPGGERVFTAVDPHGATFGLVAPR